MARKDLSPCDAPPQGEGRPCATTPTGGPSAAPAAQRATAAALTARRRRGESDGGDGDAEREQSDHQPFLHDEPRWMGWIRAPGRGTPIPKNAGAGLGHGPTVS